MTHYFFSPHPDDAALSCGGQIATLTQAGQKTVIVTVMAGDPPPTFAPTAFVEELWARWGLGTGADVTARRRAEDEAAASALGVKITFLDFADAVYRGHYPDAAAIFGPPALPDVIGLLTRLNEQVLNDKAGVIRRSDTVHLPLGIGNHIDHGIVGSVALALRRGPTVVYYEDYPYSRDRDKIEATLTLRKKALRLSNAEPIQHALDDTAVRAKITAIRCYRSQIGSFWPDDTAMEVGVRAYTAAVGGEREWRFSA